LIIRKAFIRSFDTQLFVATLQLSGSDKAYMENVTVARSIPSAEMVSGRRAAVLFFDENSASDAVVIAVYS
jgi:hypothetical protein